MTNTIEHIEYEKLDIDPKCVGCDRVNENNKCSAYVNPSIWWRFNRICPLAPEKHRAQFLTDEQKKDRVRVGQQKQKKKTKKK